MLKKVVFKNFKSFKNETVIDLTASKSEILKASNVDNGILKGGIFFGANASGKTGALNAITILLDFLFKEITFNSLHACMFSKNKLISFEYTFVIDKIDIVYLMEFDRNGNVKREKLVVDKEEYLDRLDTSAITSLTENKMYSSDDIDEKTLFLRKIYFNTKFSEYPILIKWMDYLKNSIYVNSLTSVQISFNNNTQREIQLEKYLEKYGVEEINDFFRTFGIPNEIKYIKKDPLQPSNFLTNVIFINNKTKVGIPYFLESNGNQLLIQLLPNILTICKTGGILAIDEFSSGLHNKLEELLINYIYKKTQNIQLFVVSHATNLLKTSILRPDQVFIVDYDEEGSTIHKASDSSPRESQNIEKMYLAGVFGGIPLYENNN